LEEGSEFIYIMDLANELAMYKVKNFVVDDTSCNYFQ